MTELEQFEEFTELLISLGHRLANTPEPESLKINTLKYLSDKYSVTLRNSDSSADNNKVEQSTTDEELMSKIENMALILTDSFCGDYTIDDLKQTGRFKTFQQQLKDLFKTYRNTVSTVVNQKDDNLVDEEELVSKIKSMILEIKECESRDIYWEDWFEEEIIKLFKAHKNSVLIQDLNQITKYSSRGETESKIAFKNSLRHEVEKLVTADQELDKIVENIVNFFIDAVNPVFRALNDSDMKSIIK